MRGRALAVLTIPLLVTSLSRPEPEAARAAPAPAPAGTIRFTGRNLLFTAVGEFRRWRIRAATVDDAVPERSRVEVEIDVASLDTDNEQRDEHLRGPDFFDVARHPTASVVVESFRVIDADHVEADVILVLHGSTRRFPMRFAIEDRAARRIAGRVVLRRSDFDLGSPASRWNPLSIDEEVEVRVEATVPPPTSSADAPS